MHDKFAVARALREIGGLLELKGENPFKVRAYEAGARAVETLEEDLAALVASGRLTEVRGIGEALARKIADLHATGSTALLDQLRTEFPPGTLDLLAIPELGPKKIKALHEALGIASVADLEAACAAGRVRTLRGFGEKTEAKILEGVRRLRERGKRALLADALPLGERLVAHVRASPAALRAELAGSARRFRETVGDLDVVAASDRPDELAEWFTRFPLVAEVLAQGPTKTTVRLAGGLQADLRVGPPADFATLLHHFTGSKAHHVRLRGRARDLGFTLSEWGLQRLDGGGAIPIGSEPELYAALGMPYVPPELREDEGEVEAALAGERFDDLVRAEDLRGIVHCHTTWSDGKASVEEMARAAEALGYEYLTITDHSGAAHYANGLDEDRIRRQWDEIDRVQEQVGIRLLRGTEADILEDGALDWPDHVVERLEVVVASIHTRHRQDEDAMTRRLVRIMELPAFKIWGHGLGRLVEEREPVACRLDEVLDAAARSRRVAIEVNGDPWRLDLPPHGQRLARARGLPFVLSVDAHSPPALAYVRFAAGLARRGGVRRREVLNALPVNEFARAVRPAPGRLVAPHAAPP
jgi:DNA polymerase (family 10)